MRPAPPHAPIRKIGVKTLTGQALWILSNDLNASARGFADLYKQHKASNYSWVKQPLKIRNFLGTGENAARIQIAFLPLHLARLLKR